MNFLTSINFDDDTQERMNSNSPSRLRNLEQGEDDASALVQIGTKSFNEEGYRNEDII